LAEGGRIEDDLLVLMLLEELGVLPYREVGLAAVDLTIGSRLGDLLVLSVGTALLAGTLSSTFEATDLSSLLPFSDGLRSDRVREGSADMV
jgi:hypothetical protein